jgi:short-subunit dehydrogenase
VSIAAAVEAAGPIDVLVNNAGIGLLGAFEATPMATIREVFETNTFGVMAMTQAVIPHFRTRGSGAIVNVTSSSVLVPFPLVAVYTASKTAIEGFTGVLALELGELGVRVKIVQPGYGPDTQFTANGQARMEGLIPESYAAYAQRVLSGVGERIAFTQASDVAEAVWDAVHDTTGRLRFPAGADALAMAAAA